jgi:hypothetical protein
MSTAISQESCRIHSGMGVRRPDHRPRQHGLRTRGHPRLAWVARRRLPHEGHREPRGLCQDGAGRIQQEELRGLQQPTGECLAPMV